MSWTNAERQWPIRLCAVLAGVLLALPAVSTTVGQPMREAGDASVGGQQEPDTDTPDTEEKETEEQEGPRRFTNDDLKRYDRGSSGSRRVVTDENGEQQPLEPEGPSPGDPEYVEGDTGEQPFGPQRNDQGQEAEDAEDEESGPWDDVGMAVDSGGRGEEYWRQAMADARNELSQARSERDRLQSELNMLQNRFFQEADPARRDQINVEIQEQLQALTEADQRIGAAEQSLANLEDDARRSGALPGWLR